MISCTRKRAGTPPAEPPTRGSQPRRSHSPGDVETSAYRVQPAPSEHDLKAKLPKLPPYSPHSVAWASAFSHSAPTSVQSPHAALPWVAGISPHMAARDVGPPPSSGYPNSSRPRELHCDGWGPPPPGVEVISSPHMMNGYATGPPPPAPLPVAASSANHDAGPALNSLAETALALAQFHQQQPPQMMAVPHAGFMYQPPPPLYQAMPSYVHGNMYQTIPRTQQIAHSATPDRSRTPAVSGADGAGGARAATADGVVEVVNPPKPKRLRIRGAARARAEAAEDWLRTIPRFQGFPPDPPGGWASHEELILASIPQEALALDRKKFNVWKRANNVNFKGERQRALTKIRRNELARLYARLARARKRDEDSPRRSGESDEGAGDYHSS